ncbi:Hypothetical_protein [Hexamita inflata]|uniref:Hypothetical_protein n=1 Tax=Hexamita inflata TaxID=28002 RepID=A0AA86UWZ7_9EUKA|nr:Hypothetical protein HINF_LOCUS39273 [Hexamita inflata]
MNIVQKSGTYISISSAINILTPIIQNATINDLMVNLSIPYASYQIALIGAIYDTVKFNNYQVAGNYKSSDCIALLTLKLSTASLTITNLSFIPNIFCGADLSSYLISNSYTSTLYITNLAIILGNFSIPQVTNINTSSNSTNYYSFGGIVSYISNTNITAYKIIYDCYQTYQTNYVQNAGLLIGLSANNLSTILLKTICLQQTIISVQDTQFFYEYGIVGFINGNITVQQSQISLSIEGTSFNFFGVIGGLSEQCTQAKVINLITTVFMTVGSDSYGTIAAILGDSRSQQFTIQNVSVSNSNISSKLYQASLIGYNSNCDLIVINTTSINNNITCYQYGAGGFIGYSDNSTITITQSTVQSVQIVSSSYYGVILGYNKVGNTFKITTSQSINNIINGKKYTCLSLTNTWSDDQC